MNITDLSQEQQAAVAAVMRTSLSRSIYDSDGREVVYDCLAEGPGDAAAVKEIASEVEQSALSGRDIDDAQLGRMFRKILLPYALKCAEGIESPKAEADPDQVRKDRLELAA